MKFQHTSGGFTLPGEAGQEKLTLELAEKWGADVIRDSDGTQLSEEILDTGYDIYSTICIIRDHNAWAKQHPDCLQQTFLSTDPVIATEGPLTVAPMAGFFAEQFANIDIGSIRQLPAQVHDNLTRLNEFGVPFFGSNIFRTNAEVFRNDFYNQFRCDFLWFVRIYNVF